LQSERLRPANIEKFLSGVAPTAKSRRPVQGPQGQSSRQPKRGSSSGLRHLCPPGRGSKIFHCVGH